MLGSVSAGRVDGPGEDARFKDPWDVVVVEHEQCAYLCDNTATFGG